MKNLKYITEDHDGTYELIPDWDAVAILSKYNGIRKYENSHFVQPIKAFIFDNVNVCEKFIQDFDKIKIRYDEILPENTVYYVVNNLNNLKANDYNYADKLISRSFSCE